MITCRCCQRPFGRVRTTLDALSWHEEFCSQPCSDTFRKQGQQQERVFQFLRALNPGQDPGQAQAQST
jgi:hypothetical protein